MAVLKYGRSEFSKIDKHGLEHEWVNEGFAFRPNRVLSPEEIPEMQRKILDETLEVFGRYMSDGERDVVRNTLTALFERMNGELAADPEKAKRSYLVQNWHILLRKKDSG